VKFHELQFEDPPKHYLRPERQNRRETKHGFELPQSCSLSVPFVAASLLPLRSLRRLIDNISSLPRLLLSIGRLGGGGTGKPIERVYQHQKVPRRCCRFVRHLKYYASRLEKAVAITSGTTQLHPRQFPRDVQAL